MLSNTYWGFWTFLTVPFYIYLGAVSSIGICYHHCKAFVLLFIIYSELKQTLNSGLFQVVKDRVSCISFSSTITLYSLYIVYYYNMDHLTLLRMHSSACWWIVSYWYSKHWWRSLSQIPMHTITNGFYFDWRSNFLW